MRLGLTIACALATSTGCWAGTINDTFGQSQYACVLTYTPPYDTCDVVGNEMLYDIQKASVSFTSSTATISIYMNTGAVPYGGPLTLGAFEDAGVTLIPGDIFFYGANAGYNPDDPATTANLAFGIALTNHGGFTAGGLYTIDSEVGTETAQVALQDGSDYYRWDETVLMAGQGSADSVGTVTVTANGDGVHKAEYDVTVTVPMTSGLLGLVSNGQIGLLFSAADCGNDVIQGVVNTGYTGLGVTAASVAVGVASVPEPGPEYMVLSGVILLLVGRQLRKRTKSRN